MAKLASLCVRLLERLGRPRALVGMGVVAIVAAIVGNALFLQPRMHPSPLVATRGSTANAAPAPATRDPLMQSVQDALKRLGYYSGPVDGLAGPQTAAAIRAFEAAAGRVPTDRADPDLLAALRSADAAPERTASVAPPATAVPVASPPADAPTHPDTASAPPPDPLVAAVQNALAVAAYGPLSTDGVIGPETRDAIKRFQRDHNLPVTGEISDSLVIELRATGAMRDS
jgi:peptidoglycan hydrolase-like protein with peptidoglycan-binding domain